MAAIRSKIPIILLALFLFQGVRAILYSSPTNDEAGHITAGYSYIKYNDLRFNSGGPLLINIISALPLRLLPLSPPYLSNDWSTGYLHGVAKDFLLLNNPYIDLTFFLARLPILILGLFLGIFIFKWAKDLYGITTACIALLFFSLEPNIISYSSLATSDLGITFFIFISIFFLQKYLTQKRKSDLMFFILFFLCAQLTKITALILFPLVFLLIILYQQKKLNLKKRFFLSTKIIILLFLVTLIGINLLYGFQGLSKPLSSFLQNDTSFNFSGINISEVKSKLIPANLKTTINPLLDNMPLPLSYHYLKTFAWVLYRSHTGQPGFINGLYSNAGWWYYYPFSFLIKTPIPLIIFLFLSLIFITKKFKKNFNNNLFLIVPILFIFIPSLFNHIDNGIRYILPIYPFIIILAAPAATYLFQKNKIITLFLFLWLAIGTIKISPNYLSYFNEIIGGPKNGYKHLVDSNLDWGQDIKALSRFIKDNNIQNIKVNLFGLTQLDSYNVDYQYFGPSWLKEDKNRQLSCQNDYSGWLAISATQLQGVYLDNKECFQWLKNLKPYTKIGYSIFIYKID